MDAVNTYNHISPNGPINEIETDIEKEYNDVVVLFKEGVLRAQSYVARSGRDFEELRLGCSNNERRAIERQLEKRLAAAMVAFDAAIHAADLLAERQRFHMRPQHA